MKPSNKLKITTGGAGYVKSIDIPALKQSLKQQVYEYLTGNLPIDTVRERLYNNVTPLTYGNPLSRVRNAVVFNKPDSRKRYGLVSNTMRDRLWAKYLNIPKEKLHSIPDGEDELWPSTYRPTQNDDNDVQYYKSPSLNGTRYLRTAQRLFDDAYGTGRVYNRYLTKPLNFGESKQSTVLYDTLGTHTISRGVDKDKGEYISYYDLWDLSPFPSYSHKDLSMGIGTPVHVYDRIYPSDYYGVDPSLTAGDSNTYYGGWLPNVTIKPIKNDKK